MHDERFGFGTIDARQRGKLDEIPSHFSRHRNDPQKWAQVLNNARYTQGELGAQNMDIVVVMNGGGIGMLKLESPVAQRIDDAKKAGVKFHVCEQTMLAQKVTKQDMLPQADYVPSGIADVVKLQSQGWLYVKN